MQTSSLGSSGFFDDDDATAAERPAPVESRPPAWMQAPDDELPVRLLRDTVIARTDAAVVVLRESRVFSAGFEVLVDWFVRRRTDDPWEWQRLAESAMHGGWGRYGAQQQAAALRFGIALPDGRKLRSVDHTLAMPGAMPADPPTLMQRHGGGGGGPDSQAGSNGIWVWSPEPIRGTLTFVTEWSQLEIPITGVTIDGDEIADARAGVRSLWPSP